MTYINKAIHACLLMLFLLNCVNASESNSVVQKQSRPISARQELKQADKLVSYWVDNHEKINSSNSNFTQQLNDAIRIYEGLAKKGKAKALAKLGDLYREEAFKGSQFYDMSKAIEHYKQAANKGNIHSINSLIALYGCRDCGLYSEAKVDELLTNLVKSVAKISYIHDMGVSYYKKGDTDSLKIAAKYFEVTKSYSYLAKLYYNDNGVGIDYNKSFVYLDKCLNAQPNNYSCRYFLGISYKNGLGTEKNINKAAELLYSASYSNRDFRAAHEYGSMLEEAEEYKRAVELYIRVAKYFDIESIKKLYSLRQQGHVEQEQLTDIATEIRFMYGSFDRGNKRAATCLGYMYEHGIGVDKDVDKAKAWYKFPESPLD